MVHRGHDPLTTDPVDFDHEPDPEPEATEGVDSISLETLQ